MYVCAYLFVEIQTIIKRRRQVSKGAFENENHKFVYINKYEKATLTIFKVAAEFDAKWKYTQRK